MPESTADIIVNLIAALGLAGLWLHIRQRQGMSIIERRVQYLAFALILMLVLRAAHWHTGSDLLEQLGLIPALVVPVLTLLTTEGVLRRHAPFVIKCFAVGGSLIGLLFVMTGLPRFEPLFSMVFAGFQVGLYMFCLGWVLLRNLKHLTESENRVANIYAATLVLILPLLVTDFPEIMPLPARLGAIGVLAAAYILINVSSGAFSIEALFLEIIAMTVAVGLFSWVSVLILGADNWQTIFQFAAVLVTIFVTLAIMIRLVESYIGSRHQVRSVLASARTEDIETFVQDALQSDITRSASILDEEDLSDYDLPGLIAAFHKAPVISRKTLEGADGIRPHKAVREQIDDLLKRSQASHAVLVSETPAIMVLSSIPPFSNERDFVAHLILIRKMAGMVLGHGEQNEIRVA